MRHWRPCRIELRGHPAQALQRVAPPPVEWHCYLKQELPRTLETGDRSALDCLPIPVFRQMSTADFLLSPEVQKLLQALFSEPSKRYSTDALSRKTKLATPDVTRTLEHLTRAGILTLHAGADEGATAVSVNTAFVFYSELRQIALKSFAVAEPVRKMLLSKFKTSVVRAFLLGEDGNGNVDLLVVHGELVPAQSDMSAACRRLSASLGRHMNVHVISHYKYASLTPRDALGARLAGPSVFEIIGQGQTKAKLPSGREGLLEVARRRLSTWAR